MSTKKASIPREKVVGPIAAEEFQRILSGIDLHNVVLNGVQAGVTDRSRLFAEIEKLDTKVDFSASYANYDFGEVKISSVLQEANLSLAIASEALLTLHAAFQIDYKSDTPFTDEFFNVFKNQMLLMQVIPYVRELFQSMSIRLGLPPMTLPLFKYDFADLTAVAAPPADHPG